MAFQPPFYPSGFQYGVSGAPAMQGSQPAYHPMMMMQNVQQAQQGHPRFASVQQPPHFRSGYVPGMPDASAAASMSYQQQMLVQPRGIQQILVPMQTPFNQAMLQQPFNGSAGGSWPANIPHYANNSHNQQGQYLPQQPPQNSFKQQPADHRAAAGYQNFSAPPVVQPNMPQGPIAAPPQVQPSPIEKRERKPILIVDPKTQEALKFDDLAKPSTSATAAVAAAPSPVVPKDDTARSASSSIATEFAAKVAATLSLDSTNKATSSPAVNMQPSVDAQTLSSSLESTTLKPSDVHAVDNSDNKLETASSETLLQTQLSTVEDTVDAATESIPVPSAVASSCVPDMTTNEAVFVAVPIVDSKLITTESPVVVESGPDVKPVNTASVSDLSAQSTEVVKKSTVTVVTSEASSAEQVAAEKVAAAKENVVDDPTGKDAKKKNKNKKKDVIAKGKAFVSGSEMDAFIDEKQENTNNPVITTALTEPVASGKGVDAEFSTAAVSSVENISESSSSMDRNVDNTAAPVKLPVAENTLSTDKPVEVVTTSPATDSSDLASVDGAEAKCSEEMQADQLCQGRETVESADDSKVVDSEELEETTEVIDHVEDKIELKYKYPEDPCSPLNREGKKQYDREFMMQLQTAYLSLRKPENLPPHLDIVLDEPSATSRTDVSRNRSIELGRMNSITAPDFTPGYVKSSPSGNRRPAGQKSASIKRDGGGGGAVHDQKVINLRLQKEVQLNKAENAWKPQLISKDDAAADDILATQDLYKKVRGILNKLTPQKFQTLMEQVNDLKIDTEERLMGCIDIIFEKAISEPSYSVAYANMAKRMINLTVPRAGTEPVQMVTFRTLLLNKCQREFEKDKQDELDMAARQKLIDEAESEEKRKQLLDEQEEACGKSKRRSLGNIRFIGELFKLRMLTETIMHECLYKLLRSDDEDNLECLCQLLTTIGQELDKKESKLQPRMEQYFKQLDALVADRSKVSSRIRFMILDTIDLRKNQWVLRRGTNNPKTIEQIHKEAEEEGQKIKAEMQKAAMDSMRNRRSMGGPRPGGTPATATAGEDGWNTVTRPPKVIVDPSRMKLSKQQQVDENIQLGPGGRGMGTWQFGSRGGGKTPSTPQSADTDRITQPNRFSMLANNAGIDHLDPRNRSSTGRAPAGMASGGTSLRPGREYQGSMSGPPGRPMGPRLSQERSGDLSLRPDRQDMRSPASSRSASREPRQTESLQRDESERPTSAMSGSMTQSTGSELSGEELERKTKSIVEEYLHLNDIKEATECVKELDSPKSLHLFVYHSLMLNLERSQLARQRTGALLHHLVKNRVLSNSQYVEGLRSVLELAEDMVIDIPCIWTYFSELISPMVEDGDGLPLVSLRTAFQPLLDCTGGDKAGIVMSLVLHEAVHRLGHHRVAELWQKSGLEWSTFVVPADKLDSFIEQNKLEFTLVKSSLPTTGTMPIERLQEELTRIFKDKDVEDEKVIDFLQENNGLEVDGKCIRALTNAMCSAALVNGDSQDQRLIDVSLVKKRVHLLTKLINGQQNLEIEVLFAVQVFVYKAGVDTSVFPQIFDMLYDEEVVSDVTFMKWKTNHLEGEQVGRGIAIRTLTQFFKWLEEDTTS